MGKPTVNEKRKARRAVHVGRPPRERAGEVDSRILDTARRVFLDRGLSGASIDEIARLAGAGKPTIYARFPSKEALYTAVVMRNVAATVDRFEACIPSGESIDERLTSVGANVLDWALTGDTVDLMRAGISEARRFPDLASKVHRMAKDRAEEALTRLFSEVAQSDALDALPAFGPDRLATTTQFFMNLVIMPLILRALFGAKLTTLRAEVGPLVARSVTFFLAACRHSGVD
jgi:AcrR family transcriptional regulator